LGQIHSDHLELQLKRLALVLALKELLVLVPELPQGRLLGQPQELQQPELEQQAQE
jgi:hypothetical protein